MVSSGDKTAAKVVRLLKVHLTTSRLLARDPAAVSNSRTRECGLIETFFSGGRPSKKTRRFSTNFCEIFLLFPTKDPSVSKLDFIVRDSARNDDCQRSTGGNEQGGGKSRWL